MRIKKKILGSFTKKELQILAKLDTPQKIQDYINTLPINFEKQGETCLSPREVLCRKTAHCAEGAMFAAVALWFHGQKPLLLDIKTSRDDYEHVVALFKRHGHWGAISKTNHAVLRYREPVYKTIRELALSYFHEYFKDNGTKTMRSYSAPFDLSTIKDQSWIIDEKDVWDVIFELNKSRHFNILSKVQIKGLRKADRIEIEAGKLKEI